MKTIIAATDYSESAAKSVAFAAELAREFKAALLLYNSTPPPVSMGQTPLPVAVTENLIEEKDNQLQQLAQKIAGRYKVKTEAVSSNSGVSGLKKLVHREQADLVVLGMRSNPSLVQTTFDSFTNSTLLEADFPVLIVPKEVAFQKIKKILFACDIRKLTAGAHLSFLKELAFSLDARIQVLQVVKHEKKPVMAGGPPLVLPNIESILRGVKHNYRQMEAKSVLEGIENGILEYEADLLVMVPHLANFWDSIILTGNTPEMAIQTHIPLLVLPNHP